MSSYYVPGTVLTPTLDNLAESHNSLEVSTNQGCALVGGGACRLTVPVPLASVLPDPVQVSGGKDGMAVPALSFLPC